MPGPLDAYDPVFEAAGKEWDVDPMLLKAMATQESGGRANAVSKVGAQGLMQIMPDTFRTLGGTNPNDPVESIWGGAKYMAQALAAENDPARALLYYHGGPGWRTAYGPESQGYVPAVFSHYRALQAAAGPPGGAGGQQVAGGPPAGPGPIPGGSSQPGAPDMLPPNPYAKPGSPGSVAQPAPPSEDMPPPPPPPPMPNRPPLILGDSLASRGGLGGQGVVGASPVSVLAQIDGLLPEQINGRRVVLSSGASNNPAEASFLAEQLARLRSMGAGDITVLGVGDRPDFQAAGTNGQLQHIATQNGARFVPLQPQWLSRDRVHPTPIGYRLLRGQTGVG